MTELGSTLLQLFSEGVTDVDTLTATIDAYTDALVAKRVASMGAKDVAATPPDVLRRRVFNADGNTRDRGSSTLNVITSAVYEDTHELARMRWTAAGVRWPLPPPPSFDVTDPAVTAFDEAAYAALKAKIAGRGLEGAVLRTVLYLISPAIGADVNYGNWNSEYPLHPLLERFAVWDDGALFMPDRNSGRRFGRRFVNGEGDDEDRLAYLPMAAALIRCSACGDNTLASCLCGTTQEGCGGGGGVAALKVSLAELFDAFAEAGLDFDANLDEYRECILSVVCRGHSRAFMRHVINRRAEWAERRRRQLAEAAAEVDAAGVGSGKKAKGKAGGKGSSSSSGPLSPFIRCIRAMRGRPDYADCLKMLVDCGMNPFYVNAVGAPALLSFISKGGYGHDSGSDSDEEGEEDGGAAEGNVRGVPKVAASEAASDAEDARAVLLRYFFSHGRGVDGASSAITDPSSVAAPQRPLHLLPSAASNVTIADVTNYFIGEASLARGTSGRVVAPQQHPAARRWRAPPSAQRLQRSAYERIAAVINVVVGELSIVDVNDLHTAL